MVSVSARWSSAMICGFGQRLQRVDAAAGEQRGVEFEGRVLGRGADEADGAALDVGQESVLLRLVEAMNLIDEEDGARAQAGGLLRLPPSPA